MGLLIPTTTDPTVYSGEDTETHDIPWPAGVQEGDLLLMFLAWEGDTVIRTQSEMLSLWDWVASSFSATNVAVLVMARRADGTETGTFSVTFGASVDIAQECAAQLYVVPAGQWSGDTDSVYFTTSINDVHLATDSPNPSAVAPGLGPHAWLAFVALAYKSQSISVTDSSDDYSTPVMTESDTTLRLFSQRRSIGEADSEDPSAWTLSSATHSAARTILVQGVNLEATALSPPRGSHENAVDTDLVMTFPVDVQAGTGGSIALYQLGGSAQPVAQWDIDDPAVDITDNVVTVTTGLELDVSAIGYRVVVTPGAVESATESAPFVGLLERDWRFDCGAPNDGNHIVLSRRMLVAVE